MFQIVKISTVLALVGATATPVLGQSADARAVTAETTATAQSQWLQVHFPSGSSTIGQDQMAALDQAARTFREGDPFVMIVAGGADTVGSADSNLSLSLKRATAVAEALQARGIPIDRLQVLGRGNSELKVQTPDGVAEPANRVVEISWR